MLTDPYSSVTLNPCVNCMQWDLRCRSAAAKKVRPPDKYPLSCHPDSPAVPIDRPINARHVFCETNAQVVEASSSVGRVQRATITGIKKQ